MKRYGILVIVLFCLATVQLMAEAAASFDVENASRLDSVYFQHGSARIWESGPKQLPGASETCPYASSEPSQKAMLKKLVERLKEDYKGEILLIGHSDESGEAEHNMALSKRRAQAVKRYLVDHGIKSSRIQIEAKGEKDRVILGGGEICDQLNRCVEILAMK